MLAFEWSSRKPPLGVRLFGTMLLPHNSCATDQDIMFGAQSHAKGSIMAPCKEDNRYQCLEHAGKESVISTDALLLPQPMDSVAFATNDCGAAIFAAEDTGDVVLVHPGRNQLMNIEKPHERQTIVKAAIEALTNREAALPAIRVVLVGQIRAKHFPHRGHPAEAALWEQVAVWNANIIPDPDHVTLDLAALFRAQLSYFGVDPEKFHQFCNDPYTSPDLASKRAGKPGSNVVVLTRLPKR